MCLRALIKLFRAEVGWVYVCAGVAAAPGSRTILSAFCKV
jgi:hypothetical protein